MEETVRDAASMVFPNPIRYREEFTEKASENGDEKLLQLLQGVKPAQPLILALDSDEDGNKIAKMLSNELNALQIPFAGRRR
ncbi:MAG: hypothetical protein ACRC42_00660 [Mycoplasma sp.]